MLSLPVQEQFLAQFGGSGKGSKERYATLARHPLQHRAREPWYHALSYVVDIGPSQAHAIVSQHPSLGQLMAIYADPTRCTCASLLTFRCLHATCAVFGWFPPSMLTCVSSGLAEDQYAGTLVLRY